MRLDMYLVSKEYFNTRNKAKDAIEKGLVKVNGIYITKPAFQISEGIIEIDEIANKYVSRGGFKLEKALEEFKIDLKDKIIADIGASTGGFTHCSLINGAKKVYSIDVGSNQLDSLLLTDNRVISLEQTDFRDIPYFNEEIDYYVMDVSFISIKNIIPHIKKLNGKNIITLIKPQFESMGKNINKNGILRNKKDHIDVLNNVLDFIRKLGYGITNLTYSPITGKSGNIEYLCYISSNNKSFDIKRIVEEAFTNLRGE